MTEREIFMKDLAELYSVYGIAGDYKEDVKIMLESLYNRTVFPEVPEAINRLSKNMRLSLPQILTQNRFFKILIITGLFSEKSILRRA